MSIQGLIKTAASLFGYHPAAFGLDVCETEKDLDETPRIQRERKVKGEHIDFLEKNHTGPTKIVELVGGPYDGKTGICHPYATHLWVVGDYSYDLKPDGKFHWHYDSYS